MAAKTLLFCTSYFSDQAAWAARYQRWLEHHLMIPWAVDALAIIDDGSPILPEGADVEPIAANMLGRVAFPRRALIRFGDNLGRQSTLRYPGWWRSFQLALDVAQLYDFDKIVHVESDAYVLSTRMAELIEDTDRGWTLFWSAHFQWPETAVQIICRDAFEAFARIRERGPHGFVDQPAEDVLPYTRIERSLIGDRYSDFGAGLPPNADYAVQVVPSMAVAVPTSWSRRLRYKTLARATGTIAPILLPALNAVAGEDASVLRNRAIAAYQRGDFRVAIAGLEEAITRLPDDPESHKFLAAAMMQAGRVDEAIREGERAAALAPRDAGLANMLGAFYASIDDATRAFREWQRAIRLNPVDATPLGNMQSVEARLGLPDTASEEERRFIVQSLYNDLTQGAFSRTALSTLLDLWDTSQASPKEMHAVLTVARDALTQVVGKEARGLAKLALSSGDLALAAFYAEPLATALHAGDADRLALADVMIAAGGANWGEAWQAADRARRALDAGNYLASDDLATPMLSTDSVLVYQDGDSREALIGLRFAEHIGSQGVRAVVWLEPATRALAGNCHALDLSMAATRPSPASEGCSRSIALFSLLAICCRTLAPGQVPGFGQEAHVSLSAHVGAIAKVSVRRPDPLSHVYAANAYQRFVTALTNNIAASDRTQIELSDQPAASQAAWLDKVDAVISDDPVSAFVAAMSGRPVWLMTSPEIDWRLRVGERDFGWWPNLRLLQPMDSADVDAMAAQVWTVLTDRRA